MVPIEAAPLSDAFLARIASTGTVRQFPPKTVLIHEGDVSDTLFIILEGRVKVYGAGDDGREVVYCTQGRGEFVGEMALDGGPRSASVMTVEATRCSVVGGREVREFLAAHPEFAWHLVLKLIARARVTTLWVKNMALLDVYGRIVKLLTGLAHERDGRQVVPERLTQQDIADRVGSSREMVSRILKELSSGGYITQEGGLYVLEKRLPAHW